MSFKQQIIKERFDILVIAENQTYKAEFELDKNAKILLGISITSNREDLLYHRGSHRMQLSDKELFPEGFEAKLLMSGLNVPPDQRMVTLGELPTGNATIDISYKDTASPLTAFEAYRVSIYTYSVSSLNNQ